MLAIRTWTGRRIAPAAIAALLLGAAGASVPGYAEIQAPDASAPALVPAPTQSTGFDAAFAPYDTIDTPEAAPEESGPRFEESGQSIGDGMASYYGREFAGRRTASGERFDPAGFTAAHRSLPFGSKVRVTNTRTGASVVVRINDRGPFARGRVIDVSQAAARDLGLIGPGSGRVSLALLSD
jgi:rare lipoprotein A